MQKYRDVVQDRFGNAQAGASIQVNLNGSSATIYSDNDGTPATNPITSDANGAFQFFANPGEYTLTISGANITTQTITVQLDEALTMIGYGAIGDGVTDDTESVINALNSGKIIDGGGLTYAVSGTITPTSFAGLKSLTLKQLTPTASNCKTLVIDTFTDFVMEDVTIDRGGSAGYTVGTLAAYAGLWIEDCSKFTLSRVRVTNGGRGNGISLQTCEDFTVSECLVDEHYWQEVNPASPVITDDIIQAYWYNNCSDFLVVSSKARNCTSGSVGDYSTNVDTNQERRYTRSAFGGCTNFTLSGCTHENLDQCFDLTGTVGNTQFIITGCEAINAGTYGFKFANSAYSGIVSDCIAIECGRYGYIISGMTEVANPLVRDIDFDNCKAINCGTNGIWTASSPRGFRIASSGVVDASYPRSIRFKNCSVVDNQAVPTTDGGFACDVAPIGPNTTGYLLPESNTCVNCSVVGVIASGNYYNGIHFQAGVYVGTGAGAVSDSTWTSVNLSGTEIYDPAALHSTSFSTETIFIKSQGIYLVTACAQFAANTTGVRRLRIAIGGSGSYSPEFEFAPHPTGKTTMQGTTVIYANSGNTITAQVWQNSGGSLNVERDKASLSIVRVQ